MVTLAVLAAGAPAIGAAAGFYLGAGAVGSELEPRVNNTGFTVIESNGSGGQFVVGLDLNRYFSVEGYYSNMGAATLESATVTGDIEYQSAGVTGLYYFYGTAGTDSIENRQGLLFYGKAGIGLLENDSANGVDFNRVNKEHLVGGAGVEYGMSSGFGLRAEFLTHDKDASSVSVNLIKRFGPGAGSALFARDTHDAADNVNEETPAADIPTETVQEPEAEMALAIDARGLSESLPATNPAVADSDDDGVLDAEDKCSDTIRGARVDASGCVFSGVVEGVNFASGSADLGPTAMAALNSVIEELGGNPDVRISVQSHTDNRGDAGGNMELSRQRAVTVVRFLSEQGGIDLNRMEAIGFGESQPAQSNQTAEGRAANRRVEISIVQ